MFLAELATVGGLPALPGECDFRSQSLLEHLSLVPSALRVICACVVFPVTLTAVRVPEALISDGPSLQRPGLDTVELSLYFNGFILDDDSLFLLLLLSVFIPSPFLLFTAFLPHIAVAPPAVG